MEKVSKLKKLLYAFLQQRYVEHKIENCYLVEILVQIYVEKYYLNTVPYAYMFLISTLYLGVM